MALTEPSSAFGLVGTDGQLPTSSSDDRPPPTPERRVMVPVLDGFRGLAIAGVVLYHCLLSTRLQLQPGGTAKSLVAAGYIGVDFFFVISGFVLFLPTVLNNGRFGDVREYARRRVARIVPAYWVFLVLIIVLRRWLLHGPAPRMFDSASGVLSLVFHLTFLQTTVGRVVGAAGFELLAVAWTLSIEVWFYLLLPLVAARYYRHPWVGLAIAITVSLAWRAFATNVPATLGWLGSGDWSAYRALVVKLGLLTQLPNYLADFAAGMTAAWAFTRLGAGSASATTRRWAVGVQVASAAVLLHWLAAEGGRSLPPNFDDMFDHFTRTTPIALVFGVLVLATALGPRWAQFPVGNRLIRGLGEVSYGVYLSHLAVIAFVLTTLSVAPDASASGFVTMVAIVAPASLLLGWLSSRIVEEPARAWARRRRQEAVQPHAGGPTQGLQVP